MSDTPRTDAELAKHGQVDEYLCRELERELARMRKDNADLRAEISDIQSKCEHEWEHVDDSFSREFGTQVIRYDRCEKCGKQKEQDDGHDEGCDDEPDYDAERPLTPLENHQRNDEHNIR